MDLKFMFIIGWGGGGDGAKKCKARIVELERTYIIIIIDLSNLDVSALFASSSLSHAFF